MEQRKASTGFLMFCALVLYTTHCMSSGINPAIAALQANYPDAALSTVALISSIVLTAAIPGNLLFGTFINLFGFKPTLFAAYIIGLVGGLIPFFIADIGLGFLIVTRAMVGFSFGMMLPAGASMIGLYFDESKRPRMLGWGQSVSGITGTLLPLGAGLLLSISLQAVYLYHLILVLPFICTLFIPAPPKAEGAGKSKEASR